MSTAYADLESRNQQLQLRVIQLEAEQAIYEQFKRQTVEELEALRRSREVLEQKHTELKREITEERQQYAQSLRMEKEQNRRLLTQVQLQQQQRQQFDDNMGVLKQQCEQLQEQLLRKTQQINSYFSKKK